MDWKKKTLLFYSVGGLVMGVIAGIITINNAVEKNKEIDMTLKDSAKLGLAAMEVIKKTIIK